MVRVGNLEKGQGHMMREASALLDNTHQSKNRDRVRHSSYAIMNLTVASTCSISAGAMRAPFPVAITSSRGRDASGCFAFTPSAVDSAFRPASFEGHCSSGFVPASPGILLEAHASVRQGGWRS